MGRLLQINPVVRKNTSTGKIMREIGEIAVSNGWESYLAYSRGRDGVPADDVVDGWAMVGSSRLVPVGSRLSVALHGVLTRLFDAHGEGSVLATLRFIREIRKIDPDIIHIHNIHGYFLSYRILMKFLAGYGKPVIWTVHDCWLYTGHCYYYTAAGCARWTSGCGKCPQKHEFPRSFLVDRSALTWRRKAESFNSLAKDRFVIVPVSEWIGGEMSRSFLKDCRFHLIHNGIDTEVFKPCPDCSGVREKYGLGDRKVFLGLASIWMKEKGFDDFVRMAGMIREDEVLVMVGKMTPAMKERLPESVVTIDRTEDAAELAALYSAATVFLNPTYQDNYPTVNLEAISCGTPIVTYRVGGSPEAAVEDVTGFIMEKGDVAGLMAAARFVSQSGKERFSRACREFAEANFRKEDRYKDYIELYESLTVR